MAEKTPAKRGKTVNHDANGRFAKGNNANPRGRPPLPPDARAWATKDMGDLHEMSDDETVPVKVRADIKRWMVEMVYGKAAQAVDMDANVDATGRTVIEFKGEIADWAK